MHNAAHPSAPSSSINRLVPSLTPKSAIMARLPLSWSLAKKRGEVLARFKRLFTGNLRKVALFGMVKIFQRCNFEIFIRDFIEDLDFFKHRLDHGFFPSVGSLDGFASSALKRQGSYPGCSRRKRHAHRTARARCSDKIELVKTFGAGATFFSVTSFPVSSRAL